MSCGDDGGGPTVDSQLLGIYRITSYQGSTVGCEQPSELDPAPAFVLLYSFLPNDDPDEPLLGGLFCGTVESCRQAAQAASEPSIGYSFIEGNDSAGWRGWAIAGVGRRERSMSSRCAGPCADFSEHGRHQHRNENV